MAVVYLDNNATTRVDPEVLQAMLPYFTDYYGNASSMHSFGGGVGGAIREARERLARLLGARAEEIVFTSGGTESDSTAIRAAIEAYPAKRHLLTSRVEHPAIKNLFETLAKKGYRVTFVPVDAKGRLDLDYLYDHLSDDTAIVSLMWANNETGVLFPVEEISQRVKERGIVFHTDAVQAVGKVPIRLADTGVDMLALSGHKLHGPKGIGALYIRKGTKFAPFMIGGHQEQGRRGGTENTAGIVGLGKAAEIARHHLESGSYRCVSELRDRLEQGLLASRERQLPLRERAARPPRTGPARIGPQLAGERRPGQPPPQHDQHRLRVRRGGGHPADAQRARDLRLLGLGLHLRLARALSRAARDGGAVHRGARLHPLQPQPLHHRCGDRPGAREAAADHRAAARALALLEEGRNAEGGPGQGVSSTSLKRKTGDAVCAAPPAPSQDVLVRPLNRDPLEPLIPISQAFSLASTRALSQSTQGPRPSPVRAESSKIGMPGCTWRM